MGMEEEAGEVATVNVGEWGPGSCLSPRLTGSERSKPDARAGETWKLTGTGSVTEGRSRNP
jgi:hypothetical protein